MQKSSDLTKSCSKIGVQSLKRGFEKKLENSIEPGKVKERTKLF